MRQHIKDHWYIAIALIAIFAAGNGFGYVFGSKRAGSPPLAPTVATATWANATLEGLRRELDLTAEQIEAVRPQIESTAAKVIAARERTLLDYHVLLLTLHDELGNALEPAQRERLEKSKASLENAIRSRFSGLMESEN